MKKLKINEYQLRCIEIKGRDEISVTVLKNGIFKSGGVVPNTATDEEIKTYSISLLEKCKNPIQL